MKKWKIAVGTAAVLVLGGVAATKLGYWQPEGAVAQAPRASTPRSVPVDIATATLKKVPVRIDLLGTVTPIASVAVKTRLDSEIVAVHFKDGVIVKQGDPLFSLDGRSIEAQIKQFEGLLKGAKAQLEQAQRDVDRYTELLAKSATTQVTLSNAKTQVNIFGAAVESNTAQLELLRVQLDYTKIVAPISGRVSMATVKVGNFVRQADLAPLATIIQTAPVYVSFPLPQRSLPDLRRALEMETATIQAIVPGENRKAGGQVTMIENTVDPTTGTVAVRATMPNKDELLWPGTLVTVQLTFREEEAVTIPGPAVQVSQTGSYVFVVKDGKANIQPVIVARVVDGETVLASGLKGGEAVVTEGQLLLKDGSRVAPRGPKSGA